MNVFFSNFLKLKSVTASKPLHVSRMKLLTSGDIELNPGREQNLNSQTKLSVGSTMLLNLRLRQLRLRPVDVAGEGDCFFSNSFSSVIW